MLVLRDRDNLTGDTILAGLRDQGCAVRAVYRETLDHGVVPDLRDVDVVLAYGPHNGSMMPILRLFQQRPLRDRPVLVWWLIENLPRYRLPGPVMDALGSLRVRLDGWLESPTCARTLSRPMRARLHQGQRLRLRGELLAFRKAGLPDVMVASGDLRTRLLRELGFAATLAPFGYHEVFGRTLGHTRDIDVAFIGIPGSWRRQRLLQRVREDLARRNITLTVHDGSRGFLHGDALVRYVNRCRVLLNILKHPEDSVWHRLLLGGANGALVVTEPLADYGAFEPGTHLVAAPVDEIADRVAFFLEREDRRREIADRSYRFVTTELHIGASIAHVLERCEAAHGAHVS